MRSAFANVNTKELWGPKMIRIRPASEWASGEPGIYADVPDHDYHAFPAVSNSLLSGKTPAHMKAYLDSDLTETPAMRLGRLWHRGVLQPMEFMQRHAVAQQCEARTKSGSACKNIGNTRSGGAWYCGIHKPDGPEDPVEPVSPADFEAIMCAAAGVTKDPAVREVLSRPGGFEVSIRWTEDGVVCKARIDFLSTETGTALDYKTAHDASPTGFARAAARYRYNRQQAWYTRGLEALGVPIFEFYFLAQEKNPPYAAGLYIVPSFAVDAGADEAMSRFVEYVRAKESDEWPAYTRGGAVELEWPAWADTEYSEVEEDYYAS